MKNILLACLSLLITHTVIAQPVRTLDIADLDPDAGEMLRMYGVSSSEGRFGLPIGGGGDFDGDGNEDMGVGFMTASSNGRTRNGVVSILLGDGTVSKEYNANQPNPNILILDGSQTNEIFGTELWFADVTDDGFADLVICSQNYSPPGRNATGGLTIIPGGPHIRKFAELMQPLDMANPDPAVPFIRVYGVNNFDRLGQWMRFADVDGDGVQDILAGADQNDEKGANYGEVWVIRGGDHITTGMPVIDFADHGSGPMDGNIARILPPDLPALNNGLHFGSTVFGGDADGNGRAEIAISAALNRSGASLRPTGGSFIDYQASGGASGGGSAVIVWDDNFPDAPWPSGFEIDLETTTGTLTVINGAANNSSSPYFVMRYLGEELGIGIDFNNDGKGDFYAADLTATTQSNSTNNSGVGVVFYDIAQYKNLSVDLDNLSTIPDGARTTIIEGPRAGSIGNDTIAIGDFNGDDYDDLVIGNPQDNPNNRTDAGTIHLLYGQEEYWPAFIDTAVGEIPPASEVEILLIQGARSNDVLIYSTSYGDIDGDGITDIITNEMKGDNLAENPFLNDVGNLVVFSGAFISDVQVEEELFDQWLFQ